MEWHELYKEVRAEMLLAYLYPEHDKRWVVWDEGSFYRNYNGDVMSVDVETDKLCLSRDGILQLLPDNLFAENGTLKGKDKESHREAMKWRLMLLKEAFAPVDTFFFRNSLALEREIAALLDHKMVYVLKTFFHIDMETLTDPLVRKAAVLLPSISKYRGDLAFVRTLLAALTRCEVEMDLSHRHVVAGSLQSWMPKVRYLILLPGLDARKYDLCNEALAPLVAFIKEWFIPFDVASEFLVKQHGCKQAVDNRLILDYNTEI